MPTATFHQHINGARALAILGIVFYHLRATYCPAGYFGVDLFLVISGFFLMQGLFKSSEAGRFDYGGFLMKKAWRILPSWALVTCATVLMALLTMVFSRVEPVLETARFSSFLCADYYIDRSGDYFNTLSHQNPLLHFWYLSITEQLYVLAPLLVVPFVRFFSRRVACAVLIILGVLSLAYYVVTTTPAWFSQECRELFLAPLGMKSAYYHLVPRLWEIVAGYCIVFLPSLNSRYVARQSLALLGLAVVVASFFCFKTGSPAVYATVAGTMLLLKYGDSGLTSVLLGNQVLQKIGTISFSLYLWHWPVMVFWKYMTFDQPGFWGEVGMLSCSVLLGYLAWRFIESLRQPSVYGKRGFFIRGSVLFCLPMIGFGSAWIQSSDYIRTSLHGEANVLQMEFKRGVAKPGDSYLQGFRKDLFQYEPCAIGDDAAQPYSFLLLGDSHAHHLFEGLDHACKQDHYRGIFLGNSCTPYWNYHLPLKVQGDAQWNREQAEATVAWLAQLHDVKYVLISQHWERRLSCDDGVDWRDMKALTQAQRAALTAEGLEIFCRKVQEQGKKVVLLRDTPRFKWEEITPYDEWQRCQALGQKVPERVIPVSFYEECNKAPDALFRQLESKGLVFVLDPTPPLCVDGGYRAWIDGELMYKDSNHLSPAASIRVGGFLVEKLKELDGKEKEVKVQENRQMLVE